MQGQFRNWEFFSLGASFFLLNDLLVWIRLTVQCVALSHSVQYLTVQFESFGPSTLTSVERPSSTNLWMSVQTDLRSQIKTVVDGHPVWRRSPVTTRVILAFIRKWKIEFNFLIYILPFYLFKQVLFPFSVTILFPNPSRDLPLRKQI